MESHNKAFGRVIRRLRLETHKSQEVFGFDAGLDRTYISLIELGQRSPTLDTIMALCVALGISFSNIAALMDAEMRNFHG